MRFLFFFSFVSGYEIEKSWFQNWNETVIESFMEKVQEAQALVDRSRKDEKRNERFEEFIQKVTDRSQKVVQWNENKKGKSNGRSSQSDNPFLNF